MTPTYTNRYFPPIFAFGRQSEASLDTSAGDVFDVNTKIIQDVNITLFPVGTPIFISSATYSSVQFLGEVQAASGDAIQTRFPIQTDYGQLAQLWKPTQSFQFERGSGYNVLWAYQPNIVTDRGATGQWFVTRVFPSTQDSLSLIWNNPKGRGVPSDWYAVRDFLDDYRRGGLDNFSVGLWERGRERSVVLDAQMDFEGSISGSETKQIVLEEHARDRSDFRFDFFISFDSYVSQ